MDDGATYPVGAPLFLNPFDGPLDWNYAEVNFLPGYPYSFSAQNLIDTPALKTTQARWKLISDSNPLIFGVSARFSIIEVL